MKKVCIILALVLAILPLNAFAATGDKLLMYESDERLMNDYIQSMVSDGETLYLLGGNNLYTYRVGEAGLTAYNVSESMAKFTQAVLDAHMANSEEAEYYSINVESVALIVKDGKLYNLVSCMIYGSESMQCEEAMLLEMVLQDDGTAQYAPVLEHIDWTDMIESYGDYSYARSVQSSCVIGNILYMSVYGMSDNMELYSFDITSGEVEFVTESSDYIYGMCAYKDETILMTHSRYNGATSEMIFCAYDIYGNEEEVGSLSYDAAGQFQNMVYDAENDVLYGVTGGMVKALNMDTMELTEIADMPLSTNLDTNKAALMNGGYYVAGGYDGICIRNLDVSLRTNEIMLRVYNGAYSESVNKANMALGNRNGNIVVVSSRDYIEDSKILENMMNRIETPDIYVLYTSSSAYDAMYNRGYMAEIKSDILETRIESMYAGVQEMLARDGEAVALPVYVYGNTLGINTKALEQMGLTLEDVPRNWLDFLKWLKGLEDNHPENMSVFYSEDTFESVKSSLFYAIFTNYIYYLGIVGEETGFDTPELRALMETLDELDFEKWGHERDAERDYSTYEYVYDENEVTLLETYASCALGNMYDSAYQPIAMAISPDAKPMLALQMAVAFINPFTKHYDEAVAYMECLAENLSNDVLYNVSPDCGEPVRYSWYEENLQGAQEYLDSLLESYGQIEEEYRQEYEIYIQEAEENLENTKNQWQISPEQIAWYRANSEYIIVEGYNALYSGESSEELWMLLEQYFAGTLDSRALLKQIDKKLQMMILEGR